LKVWQQAKTLAVKIYKITDEGQFQRDFGFKDQIRRAAVSVPSNIAEGDERGSNKDSIRFFFIAKGSLAELQTQLEIAHEIKYITQNVFNDLEQECITTSKQCYHKVPHTKCYIHYSLFTIHLLAPPAPPAPLCPVKFTVVKGNAHFTGVAPADGTGIAPADRTGVGPADRTGVKT
jgi:four helix bundle protein